MVAQRATQLAIDDGVLLARLALLELLADAQDRAQAGVDRPPDLEPDELVGLARVTTPFGVADDHPGRQPGQHRCGDLAGVGTLQLVMDGLGPDRDVRIGLGQRVADGGEGHERRADHADHARRPGSAPRSCGRARRRRRGWCASSSWRPR